MNELFERIKKILNINKCEIQINEKFIFVHINLHISIKIDDEINRKIQNIVYNHFNETSEYEDFSIKIIFSRSNEKIEKIEESKPAQESKKKKRIQGIKNIILVASGKGGVGKSTLSANLAISMQKIGWKVGLLDADIYGASIPTIFEVENKEIELNEENSIIPIEKYSVKINSIDFITENYEALIWRGPMISKALHQLLNNTDWGELDYLIIDTPPGTGDIHLTLLENYRIDGYLLISTPHITSLQNAKKTQKMFEKFNIQNCDLILNMNNVDGDENEKLFQKNENFDFIKYNEIFYLPFFRENLTALFCLNKKNEKIFLNIARSVVKLSEYTE